MIENDTIEAKNQLLILVSFIDKIINKTITEEDYEDVNKKVNFNFIMQTVKNVQDTMKDFEENINEIELSKEQKASVSHRALALNEVLAWLKNNYIK